MVSMVEGVGVNDENSGGDGVNDGPQGVAAIVVEAPVVPARVVAGAARVEPMIASVHHHRIFGFNNVPRAGCQRQRIHTFL